VYDGDDDHDGTIRNVICQESGFYPHPPLLQVNIPLLMRSREEGSM
jgi:hypothetical protein